MLSEDLSQEHKVEVIHENSSIVISDTGDA